MTGDDENLNIEFPFRNLMNCSLEDEFISPKKEDNKSYKQQEV